jgi:hypothetical protein
MSDALDGPRITLDGVKEIPEIQSTPYHPLAMDPDGDGFWGWIDRRTEQLSSWLNPILIKEARQSLKSRQFLVTFFLLLIASCFWTVFGVASNAPDVYYLPKGANLLAGYYLVLAIPLIGMVPLAAHRSLAAEIEDDTFEMLAITRLSAGRIVMGKMNSAMLQMIVYFAAIVPCIAFSYLLRGVTLPMIGTLVVVVFMTALLVTSLALLMATLAPNRAGQTLATLAVVAVIVFAEFLCGAFCMGPVLYAGFQDFSDMVVGTFVFVLLGLSCVVLFIRAAAARIAPVTENRSTGLRWIMFGQQLLWIAVIGFLADMYEERNLLSFGAMIVCCYWLLMGTLMLGESSLLSPRVLRGLPKTFAGRSLMTWFNPGPDTGYLFAIATGTVGALAMGGFGITVSGAWNSSSSSILFAIVCIGYLLSFLGLTRLMVMPLSRRFGPSFVVSVTTGLVLLALGLTVPFILSVAVTGTPAQNYGLLHISNWAWTLTEAASSGFDPAIAILLLAIGSIITAVNLLLFLRALQYHRISVPERVRQDQGML